MASDVTADGAVEVAESLMKARANLITAATVAGPARAPDSEDNGKGKGQLHQRDAVTAVGFTMASVSQLKSLIEAASTRSRVMEEELVHIRTTEAENDEKLLRLQESNLALRAELSRQRADFEVPAPG